MLSDKTSILAIDDELENLSLLEDILDTAGYQVTSAMNGQMGIQAFKSKKFDLSLVDLGLPDIDGLTICKCMHEESQMPVIIVTGRTDEKSLLQGFEAGADDYITKPFRTKILLARIDAVLRRTEKMPQQFYQCGDLRIDFEHNRVTLDGHYVDLSLIEYKMLVFMAHNHQRTLTSEDILKEVWGEYFTEDVSIVRVNIVRLRQKLNDDARRPKYILTIPGCGYQLR
jgi:two-component system, OmpR family, KDP operon response regulator KdpE